MNCHTESKLEGAENPVDTTERTTGNTKSQLEQLSRGWKKPHAKLVFFTNVSHDFRTPLTLIADPIDQLLADCSISEPSRRLLGLMKKNVHILLRLVNQILDFRKVENGRMELHLEPFDLLTAFRGWNDSFRMALLKKHIAFSFRHLHSVDFRMMADTERWSVSISISSPTQ